MAVAQANQPPKTNGPNPKDPDRMKAALPHASRARKQDGLAQKENHVPKQNSLDPKESHALKQTDLDQKELLRIKRKREHITAKERESTRPAVRRSALTENKILFRSVTFPILQQADGSIIRRNR